MRMILHETQRRLLLQGRGQLDLPVIRSLHPYNRVVFAHRIRCRRRQRESTDVLRLERRDLNQTRQILLLQKEPRFLPIQLENRGNRLGRVVVVLHLHRES